MPATRPASIRLNSVGGMARPMRVPAQLRHGHANKPALAIDDGPAAVAGVEVAVNLHDADFLALVEANAETLPLPTVMRDYPGERQ